MPLRYAVEERHPTIKTGPHSREYIPVTREVAESYERGCYALFNEEGEQCSPWAILQQRPLPPKPNPRTEKVKDAIMQTLSIGDYVAFNSSTAAGALNIGKIVAFTPKQVRVLRLCMSAGSEKYIPEQGLIRLPESLWLG